MAGRFLRQNALGLVAIFLALGGTTYAALRVPANSIGTQQLKKGAVTSSKVKRGSLTGSDLNMSSLGTVPFAKRSDEASNALALGGLSVSAFQKRINGSCPANAAINQVNSDGSVGCQPLGEFAVDAVGGPFPVTEPEGTSIPLTGDTSWTAPQGQVGLLMVQAKMKLAAKPAETCIPFIRIYDNGKPAIGTGASVTSNATLTDYLSEGGATPIGVIDRGSLHTITAAYEAGDTAGCAAGSTVEEVRVVVVPLG